MNDHTYVAADMHHAMKLVKEDMGPDAVILSHRKVMEGVEIVAAPSEMMEALQQSVQQQSAQQNLGQQSSGQQPVAPMATAIDSMISPDVAAGMDHQQGLNQSTVGMVAPGTQKSAGRVKSFSFPGLSKRSNANKAKADPGASQGTLKPAIQPHTQPNKTMTDDVMVSLSRSNNENLGRQTSKIAQPRLTQRFSPQSSAATGSVRRPAAQKPAAPQPTPSEQAYETMILQNNMELSAMRDELSGLKELLEAQFKALSWSQFSQQTPIHASVWKRLKTMGLETFLCEELVSKLGPDDRLKHAWNDTAENLRGMLPIFSENLCDYSGIVSLVGPTGAGKTTTIGKIAAHHVLKYGVDEVALVSTDSFRIASREQLNSYGRILGIPVYSVTENQTLDQVLEAISNRHRLVLIDNPGLSGDEAFFSQHLDQLAHSRFPIDNFFVMPCTSQYQVLESYLDRLNQIPLQGCIASKTDEASEIGHILSLAIGYELPIASYTNGQNIPDDIYQADPQRLVSIAIDMSAFGSASDDQEVTMNHDDGVNNRQKQDKTARMDLNDN
ncbi:MAG: flagellar biosynthesis protein FlhF [Pseudomonadales bacterium]|nr:flagellar biosynthesis protein FlhF [Pseudomonadales bacterium]